MKESTLPLTMPDFAEIIKQEEVERANAREAKVAEEDTALILKHVKDHQEFLRAIERKCKAVSPVYAEFLHNTATETINHLDALIEEFDANQMEEFRISTARRNTSWPTNISSRSPAYLANKANGIFEVLEVGKESILNVETFKDGAGDISKPSKIVVRRFIRAIMKCQLRARLDPDKPRINMECLAVSLDGLDSYDTHQWFAVMFEWIKHYGELDQDKETMSPQQIQIFGADISVLWKHAETHGNLNGDIYSCDSSEGKEFRKNLWRVFLQCIKRSICKPLYTQVMEKGKWVSKPPPVPNKVQHQETIKLLGGG
jgi:hypothetical protein